MDSRRDGRLDSALASLRECRSVLVAFSGGVDSTLVLRLARESLGDRVLAVTGRSPSVPDRELREAADLARQIGVEHIVVDTDELAREEYVANGPDRCYHCKSELFDRLEPIRARRGLARIVDGTNADDASDHRPGIRARRERGILSPLAEAGMTKVDVRAASEAYGLPTADKPAMACLASRFPYGTPVTPEGLSRVGAAEEAIRALGFRQFRVRHHGDVARLEVDPAELDRALAAEMRARIVAALKEAGYRYAAVDLEGYRTGSLNEVLTIGKARPAPGNGGSARGPGQE